MPQVRCQHGQTVVCCYGGDCEVREPWALTYAASAILQRTGNSCSRDVKRQNTGAIKMQERLEPSCKIGCLSARPLSACFCYAIGNLSDGDS